MYDIRPQDTYIRPYPVECGQLSINEVIRVNLENESLKDEISDLKKVIEKWTCSKVTLDQLLSEQVPEKIINALGGKETKSPAVSLPQLKKKVDLSAEQLLLTLMDEVKSLKEQIKVPSNNSPSVSQTGILSLPKGNKPPAPQQQKPSIANRRSTEPTKKAAFVNGLKHNLISINQLCDANYKVLFTKTKGTTFNQNDEVVLISPRRKDVYVIDMVFNIRRQEMKETYHVTFSEDDEAISQSSTEGDAINFNENRLFPDDEFLEPRNSVSPEEPHVFTSADDHPALNDHVHTESADNLDPAKIQYNVIIKSIGNVQSSPTIILPSTAVDINPIAEGTLQPPIPQGRWSREKQIELVNIIGEPLAEVGLETQKLLQLMNVYMLTFSLKWNPRN
ncbi:hypothetical protein Tco_1429207 [Tanacetum coccineum]